MRGSTARGMPNAVSSASSQSSVARFISCVRLALVTSVTMLARSECHSSQRIDRAEQQVAGFRAAPRVGHIVEQPVQLQRAEIAGQRQAGLGAEAILAAIAAYSATSGSTRVSCQTSALCTGAPVARSHSSVVSRWLVMPIAARSRAARPRGAAPRRSPTACCARSPAGRARPSRAAGRSAGAPSAPWRSSRRARSNTMKRVLVVPWSIAPMYRVIRPPTFAAL